MWRERRRLTSGQRRQLGSGDDSGARRQVHRRGLVVGGQRPRQLVTSISAIGTVVSITSVDAVSAIGSVSIGPVSTGTASEGVGEGLRDPPRVGMREREVAQRIGVLVGRQLGDPGRLVALGDLAQHGIDEPGRAAAAGRAHQVHR
jgi:hypothetical protein